MLFSSTLRYSCSRLIFDKADFETFVKITNFQTFKVFHTMKSNHQLWVIPVCGSKAVQKWTLVDQTGIQKSDVIFQVGNSPLASYIIWDFPVRMAYRMETLTLLIRFNLLWKFRQSLVAKTALKAYFLLSPYLA